MSTRRDLIHLQTRLPSHRHVLIHQVFHSLLPQTVGDSLLGLQVAPVRPSSTVHEDEHAKMLHLRIGVWLQDKTRCLYSLQSCPDQHFFLYLFEKPLEQAQAAVKVYRLGEVVSSLSALLQDLHHFPAHPEACLTAT